MLSNKETLIYLVRHGQSIHNAESSIAGQLDSTLTARGFEDARFVARMMKGVEFDLVYCSDLGRARQTAETIVETLECSCPLQFSPLLRELDYGDFTGRNVMEAFRFLNYKVEQNRRYPGGEGFHELKDRLSRFIEQLRGAASGQRILIAAHAGSLRMLLIVLDPSRKEELLGTTFSNRYVGKISLDETGRLSDYEVIHNDGTGFI